MTSKRTEKRKRMFIAYICFPISAYLISIGAGWRPVPEESLHAPGFVLVLAGIIFSIAGLALLAGPERKRLTAAFAAIILLSFSIIGFWIAGFGNGEQFSGGVPFLPKEANTLIARVVFGGGAVMSLLLAWMAFKQSVPIGGDANR